MGEKKIFRNRRYLKVGGPLLLAISLLSNCRTQEKSEDNALNAEPPTQELIEDLGSPKFQERARATKILKQRVKEKHTATIEALKSHNDQSDSERSRRIQEIMSQQ